MITTVLATNRYKVLHKSRGPLCYMLRTNTQANSKPIVSNFQNKLLAYTDKFNLRAFMPMPLPASYTESMIPPHLTPVKYCTLSMCDLMSTVWLWYPAYVDMFSTSQAPLLWRGLVNSRAADQFAWECSLYWLLEWTTRWLYLLPLSNNVSTLLSTFCIIDRFINLEWSNFSAWISWE